MSASCLAPDVLLAWVHGKLADTERPAALAHIEHCAGCREALSALAQIATIDPSETVHDAKPRKRSPLDLLGIGARLGRFRILRVLGVGGMGIVVAARDEQLHRDVAIKLVRPDLAETTPRLLREAQALAALRHEHLVHVLDVGEVDGTPFLVMELVDGPNLRRWTETTQPAWTAVLAHCIAAGRGLAALHAAGYLHRDVKPDNVLVARDGRVVLADFGLAKRMTHATGDAQLTQTGAIVGTPRYLAPERVAGEPGDERSDIYAWSVMTLELVRSRTDALPPRIQAALDRGADADPTARFPTVDAMLAALAPRRRRAAIIVVPLALVAIAGGAWIAARNEASTPIPDAAIGAGHDAAIDVMVDAAIEAAIDAPVDAVRIAAAPRDAAPDAAPDARTKGPFEHELTIAYLRDVLHRRPATSAIAEAAVMANGGVCKEGVNLPLGWDWGKVERKELVDVTRKDGKVERELLYQVLGQERRYLFNAAYAMPDYGYLDVPVGALVLVCRWRDRDDVVVPAGWRGNFISSTYFGGPIAGPSPVLAKRPTHLTGAPHLSGGEWPHEGPVLFLFKGELANRVLPTGRRDMGHYYLDADAALVKQLVAATHKQPVWVLATFVEIHERGGSSYPVLRVLEVRRTLFDPK